MRSANTVTGTAPGSRPDCAHAARTGQAPPRRGRPHRDGQPPALGRAEDIGPSQARAALTASAPARKRLLVQPSAALGSRGLAAHAWTSPPPGRRPRAPAHTPRTQPLLQLRGGGGTRNSASAGSCMSTAHSHLPMMPLPWHCSWVTTKPSVGSRCESQDPGASSSCPLKAPRMVARLLGWPSPWVQAVEHV